MLVNKDELLFLMLWEKGDRIECTNDWFRIDADFIEEAGRVLHLYRTFFPHHGFKDVMDFKAEHVGSNGSKA